MLEEYYYPIPFLPKICGLNLKQSDFCVGGSLHLELKFKISFCSVKRPGKVILQLDLIDLSLVKFKISGPLFVDIVQNLPGRWNLTIIAEIYRQFPLIPTNRNVWIIPPGAGQSRFLGPCPFTARCRSLKIPRQQQGGVVRSQSRRWMEETEAASSCLHSTATVVACPFPIFLSFSFPNPRPSPFIALACLVLETPFTQSFVVSERERESGRGDLCM